MTPTEISQLRVPPQAVVCARLVLRGFGHDVATEHVIAALKELLIWQNDNPRGENSPRSTE